MAPPQHPNYVTRASRFKSFDLWPLAITQKPEELVEAGFFYTGKGDRVICYFCGGGLKDWHHVDSPWHEHARWFSGCPYLILMKGQEFIDGVHLKTPKPKKEKAEPKPLAKPQAKPQEDGQSKEPKCKICFDHELRLVFLPCGHFCTCLVCGTQVMTCPICQSDIKSIIKAYLS
jgi:hypothetical protein